MRFFCTTAFHVRAILVGVIALGAPCASAADESEPFHRFWPDNLFAVDFVTAQTGYIAGQEGTVLRTTNGGENWDAFYIGRNELVRRVSFTSETEGWAVGHRGSIFHTADAGTNWEVQYELPGTYLRDVSFVDKDHGWVVGHDATILHTSDGGASWQKQQMRGFTGRDLPRFHGIYAKDENTAVVVGEFGTIVHTEDAGELWTITPPDVETTWLAVDGAGEKIFMVGLDGNIGYLSLATEDQREQYDREKTEQAARAEAKARKKAKRRKKKYVPRAVEEIPRSAIEYAFNPIASGTEEHIFDLSVSPDGTAIAVGRSTVLRLSEGSGVALDTSEALPLDFVWFGGAAITPEGSVWLVGIRGLVAYADNADSSLAPAFNLGASGNVKMVTSQWVNNNGQ